jgi:hypothetical protein
MLIKWKPQIGGQRQLWKSTAEQRVPLLEDSSRESIQTDDVIITQCTTVHFIIQINHQPDATIFQFVILTFIYSSTCFGRFPAYHQELNDCISSLWFYFLIVVIVVLLVVVGPAGRPDHDQQHCYHQAPTVNQSLLLQLL